MADKHSFLSALCGGAAAGLVTDITLFPLDTLKTRLQAEGGFVKSGGFNGVYRGIGPILIGSAPQAAIFFCSYEAIKDVLESRVPSHYLPLVHMSAASVSEVVACTVRVPLEVVKQRRQTTKQKSLNILLQAYRNEGFKGLYRGFGSTVTRDVPFVFVQFPILEYLKVLYKTKLKTKRELHSWEVAGCGSIAGGISAAVTTPLDVIKTRIMLADRSKMLEGDIKMSTMLRIIYTAQGVNGLFAGFIPRVLWISLGGCVFFGVYDFCKSTCSNHLRQSNS